MKKKTVYILFFCVFSLLYVTLLSSSKLENKSNYKVIKVNGKILFVKSGADLKRGDEFAMGTPLDFVTTTSRAAVISQSVRYVLQANSKGKVKILPATSNVTSRSGVLINLIDLQNHFSGRYLIFENEKLQIGTEAFPMNKSCFFYVKYEYKGESIAKQLSFENNYLTIKKDELFKIDGVRIEAVEKEMTLYYRNEESKKSYRISTFTPVFPDFTELKAEASILLTGLGDVSVENKITEITAYLNDFYGKPQKDNLSNWLESEFKLSVEKDINFK